MKLLYRPREPRFIGEGTLPFGTYDDTGDWAVRRTPAFGGEDIILPLGETVALDDHSLLLE